MADSEQVMEALYPDLAEPLESIAFAKPEGTTPSRHLESSTERLPADAAQSTIGNRPSAISEPRVQRPEIIGIVVNEPGLERALKTPGLTTVGYPYSVSANFRRANANMSKAESQALVARLHRAVSAPDAPVRNLVVYISMAFGNNYDEPWGPEIVIETVEWLREVGVKQISLADTVGVASAEEVGSLYRAVAQAISVAASDAGSVPESADGWAPTLEIGVHLHSRPDSAAEKILAAYEAGCRRFDSALTGLGGCPFAGDDLVGNIPTEILVSTLSSKGVATGIEPWALLAALKATGEIRKQFA
jgi:hydroxymethylglutaryl-CoA lyase